MTDTRVGTEHTPVRATARFLARHPRSSTSTAATGAAVGYFGVWAVAIAATTLVVAGVSWRLLDAPSFDRFAGRVLRAWWRRWAIYQRQWQRIASSSGLMSTDHKGTTRAPRIVRARSTWCWDTLTVRMTKGQNQSDYEAVLDRLSNAYRARQATLRTLKPGTIALDFQRHEPFDTMVIPPSPLAEPGSEVDLSRLVIGKDEYGRDYPLDLVNGLHALFSGSTGAGKGSFIWGAFRALAPMIRTGSLRLWVIDPKGGMEFSAGRAMFHRFADNDHDGLALLQEFTDVLDNRKLELGRQGVRSHTPSPDSPLELLVVDELAAMTSYTDRLLSREFESLLSKALTQYRAAGGRVMGATQEPTKDTVPMRGLFPIKIALRLDEASYVDMTLGEGMRDKGAFADQIPTYMPGVAYEKREGHREPLRVRAGFVSDDDITELVDYCTADAPEHATVTPLHPKADAQNSEEFADIEDAEFEVIDPDEDTDLDETA